MNKTSFFSKMCVASALAGVVLLTNACSPQDPPVLTAAEKNKFNKSPVDTVLATGAGDVSLPAQVDLQAAEYLLERKSEFLALVSFAQKVTQNQISGLQTPVGACSRLIVRPLVSSEVRFSLLMKNCLHGTEAARFTQKGRIEFVVQLDSIKQIESMTISTEKLALNSPSILTTQYLKKVSKYTNVAVISEQLQIEIFRSQNNPQVFEVAQAETLADIQSSAKNRLHYGFKTSVVGQIEFLPAKADGFSWINHSLESTLEISGQVLDMASGLPAVGKKPLALSLSLSPSAKPTRGEQNSEVLGLCSQRKAGYEVSLDFSFKRDRDLLQVSSDGLQVTSAKDASRVAQLSVKPCDSTSPAPDFAGLTFVDWTSWILL